MSKIISILLIVVSFGFISDVSAVESAESILKHAKKEAQWLPYSKRIQPKRKSDDAKYVTSRDAAGHEFVDRSRIALDLFNEAANAGSGEAAYILFCYYCMGKYDGQHIFEMNVQSYEDSGNFMNWENNFSKGLAYLQLAVDLNWSDSQEYYILKNRDEYRDAKALSKVFCRLYDAMSGNPIEQWCMAGLYKDVNPVKYEYWIKRSLEAKNWPLASRVDYATYLLDSGRREEALSILKPAEEKDNYTNDNTANSLIFNNWNLFYVADCLYSSKISEAIHNCDNLYKGNENNVKLKAFYHKHDTDYLEYYISYFASPTRRKLFESVHAVNKNTTDNDIIFRRGNVYEAWGDSIKAFDCFKKAALSQNSQSILKSLDYASKGYKLSNNEIAALLPKIIVDEQKNGDFSIPNEFANWKVCFILGEFFYNSDYRDYGKAVRLYKACINYSCPRLIKGACAKQLFKCYEFGRGVSIDREASEKWLNMANSIGNVDAEAIYDLLFPPENKNK